MNRERKFRFWCTSENRFITDPVIHGDGRVSAKTGICGRDYYYDVIIQEYTGLNDKNDVEIFEGDYIRGQFDHGPAGFREEILPVRWSNEDGYQWNYWDLSTIEVIGNIFENPDLLKNEPRA